MNITSHIIMRRGDGRFLKELRSLKKAPEEAGDIDVGRVGAR
jgi:hypothetical protein